MLQGGHLGARDQGEIADLFRSARSLNHRTLLTLLFLKAYLFIICLFYTHICTHSYAAAMALEFEISLLNHFSIQSANTYPASLLLFVQRSVLDTIHRVRSVQGQQAPWGLGKSPVFFLQKCQGRPKPYTSGIITASVLIVWLAVCYGNLPKLTTSWTDRRMRTTFSPKSLKLTFFMRQRQQNG